MDAGELQCVVELHHLAGLVAGAEASPEEQEAAPAAILALDYWLERLQACAQLQPLASRVFFACPPEALTGAAAWARLRGLPAGIIRQAQPGAEASTHGAGLCIDAAWVFGDSFSLSRLIDTARLRAKDVAVFCKGQAAAASGSKGAVAAVVADASRCPALVQPSGSGAASSRACSVLPCAILSAASRSQRSSRAVSETSLLAPLLAGRQLHGFEVQRCWTAGAWLRQRTAQAAAAARAAQPSAGSSVPERFQDAERWDYSSQKREHPVYQTSSAAYGSVLPSQHDLPPSHTGIRGGLSGLQPARGTSALRTGLRKSNVHASLEGW